LAPRREILARLTPPVRQRIINLSRRPSLHLDHTALHRVFGRSRAPRSLSIEGRVALLAEVAAALLNGALPSKEARMFVGGALSAWLAQGGDLSREFLKVVIPKSHRTASKIFQELQAQSLPHPDDVGESAEPGKLEGNDANFSRET
jgi:hypothetical protein